MNNNEIICGGLIGSIFYIGFLVMFVWAVWKGDFIFHYGRVRGKTARVIGAIGLLGMAAGTYLLVSNAVFHTTPPLSSVAWSLVGLLIAMLFVVRFLALFIWRDK